MSLQVSKFQLFLNDFIDKFLADETTTLSASLAFYTALSIAPLLIIFVAITSQFSPGLKQVFLEDAEHLIGPQGAVAFDLIISGAQNRSDLSTTAGWAGAVALLVSSGMIFGELRFALNKIFQCPAPNTADWSVFKHLHIFLKAQVVHIGIALSFVLIMIASLSASSLFSSTVNIKFWLWNLCVSFVFCALFFSSMFRFMPRPRIPWGQAIYGGFMTAVLFIIGKELIGIYLGNSALGSAYGAASSLVVLMVWIYYSSLITFFGAQLSAMLAHRNRKIPEVPCSNATPS